MPNTREKLIELLSSVPNLRTTKGTNEEIADHLVANGAAFPVLCENCKYWDTAHCSGGHGWCQKTVAYRRGDWYCAGGKKKEV